MSDYVDADGYPTEGLMKLLSSSATDVDLFGAAAEYFNACGYGRATQENGEWKFAIGGWSGCEDVIGALMENPFARVFWESNHRGGLYIFSTEP